MQVNMSAVDIIISLVVGIIGSVVAPHLAKRAVALQTVLKDFFAKRSLRATEKRLSALQGEVLLLRSMDENPIFRSDILERKKSFVRDLRFSALLHLLLAIGVRLHETYQMVSGSLTKDDEMEIIGMKTVTIYSWGITILLLLFLFYLMRSWFADMKHFNYLCRLSYVADLQSSINGLEERLKKNL